MNHETFKNSVFCLKNEMYRFAKRFLISSDEAEDVVQDLMVKLWQMRQDLVGKNIKSYAMRAVKNECVNRLKHHGIKENFARMEIYNNDICMPEINNLKEKIVEFINQLPEKQKMVMHLKDVEEYEVYEISEILEIEENAVRVNLMRARQKVRIQITNLMNYEEQQIHKY